MPAHLDRPDEYAPIPAKSDSPLPSPVLPIARHHQHSPHSTADHHRQQQPKSCTPAVAAVAVAQPSDDHSQLSAVRRTLAQVPEVDAIDALFRFDRKKHVLGAGMYATVFRALPTLDACRRFDLPVAHHGGGSATTTTTATTTPAARRSSSLPTSPMTPGGAAPQQPCNAFPRGNSADGSTDADSAFPPSAAARVAVSGPVALKEVHFASIADAKEARNVLREISVLRRLRHPHVTSLIGAVRTKTAVYIAMPLAPGVTLTKLLRAAQRDGVAIPEKAVSGIVQQLLLALRHVQRERGMIHRDVKLDNVLVAVSSLAAQPLSAPSCGGNRQSSNKAPGEMAEAASPWCLEAIASMDPCDPAETLAHLFEPGAAIHVTLVDFGFARSVSAPSAQATACESSVVSPVPSSCAHFPPPTPGLPTARSRQQGGIRSPTPPSVGSPICCCAPTPLAAATAKVAYTPCGAHRFMPPEALAALLRAGSVAPPVPLVAHPAGPPNPQAAGARSPPSPAAPHPQKQQQQQQHAPTSPQHTTPAAHGEAPGVDRDVPPVDAAAHDDADSRIDGADTSDDEAYGKKNGSRNWTPNASCADSASGGPGGDSDMGSVGGGVAFATASDLRKADPFAVGVVAYALLSGCFPWAGETPARLLDTMHGGVRMKAPAWSDVSDAGRELVRHLLCHNPGERPTVEHALEHSWFVSSVTTPTRPC